MRDIVLKKKSAPLPVVPAVPAAPVASAPTASRLVPYVEKTIAVLGDLGSRAATLLNPEEGWTVRRAKRRPSRTQRLASTAAKKERLKERGQKAASAARHAAKRAGAGLKTPTGKLAALQVATVVALVGYVAHTTRLSPSASQGAATAKTLPTSQYRLLPSIKNTGTTEPFKETTAVAAAGNIPLETWVTPWNSDDVVKNLSRYGSLSAFWLSLASDGFTVAPKSDWSAWEAVSVHRSDTQQLYLTVTADPDYSSLALGDGALAQKQIDQLLQTVQQHGFDGIDIDYEGLGKTYSDSYVQFVKNLAAAFHAQHKLVAVTVEARIANQVPMDWRALSQSVDEIRVMVYDYHSQKTDTPGPIAPLGWLKEVLDYTQQTVDTGKLIVGLGNYGYDWTQKDDGTWQGTGISYDQAVALAAARKTPVVHVTGIDDRGYDMGAVPAFTYKDDQGHQHAVWFEDASSLQSKVDLVSQYKVKGIIFWSVGIGDQTFWNKTSQ